MCCKLLCACFTRARGVSRSGSCQKLLLPPRRRSPLVAHSVPFKSVSCSSRSRQAFFKLLYVPRSQVHQSDKHAVLQARACVLWASLCDVLRPYSRVLQDMLICRDMDLISQQILALISNTTAVPYLTSCTSFLDLLFDGSPEGLLQVSQVQVVDPLQTLRRSGPQPLHQLIHVLKLYAGS